MIGSDELEDAIERNIEERRAFIKQWAAYVRDHDDAEWSRQQNTIIDSQLQRANELAKETDGRDMERDWEGDRTQIDDPDGVE